MYGKTSVTLTGDELFYMKVSLGMQVKEITGYVEAGDPHGVWGRQLAALQSAYKKIERASRRV